MNMAILYDRAEELKDDLEQYRRLEDSNNEIIIITKRLALRFYEKKQMEDVKLCFDVVKMLNEENTNFKKERLRLLND